MGNQSVEGHGFSNQFHQSATSNFTPNRFITDDLWQRLQSSELIMLNSEGTGQALMMKILTNLYS
jgi:hypothetical protein